MMAKPSPSSARDLDLTPSARRSWVLQARADRTKGRTGLTTAEREELARLRKENRELRMERDVLKKPRQVQPVNATAVAVYQLAWHIPASGVDVS